MPVKKREPERFVPAPLDLNAQLVTDGKILARLIALAAGLFVFGGIALNAGFRAAAALSLLAVPAVLMVTLLWYKAGGALDRSRQAWIERRKQKLEAEAQAKEGGPGEEKAA